MAAIDPAVVYECYPGADMMPIMPPEEYDNFNEFLKAVEHCGDTLFKFIVYELLVDECDKKESLRRLDTAIKDLQAVYSHIESEVDE
jgi:hypothetical protein